MSNIKYDDTDYLINREESIEYKISDTNVGNIEEDIKRCEQLIKPEHASWIGISNQLAIAHLIEKIKELEEENKILKFQNKQVENYTEELKKYNKTVSDRIVEYKKNSISKQKVKDKIEELKNAKRETIRENWHYIYSIQLKILEELLEEK